MIGAVQGSAMALAVAAVGVEAVTEVAAAAVATSERASACYRVVTGSGSC